MAKTKRKHLAALAAMSEAGGMKEDAQSKVKKKQVEGGGGEAGVSTAAPTDAEGCDVTAQASVSTVPRMIARGGRRMKASRGDGGDDGASLSKAQQAEKLTKQIVRARSRIQPAAEEGAGNKSASIEVRKQRVIIKIPPLPQKLPRKRKNAAPEPVDDGYDAKPVAEDVAKPVPEVEEQEQEQDASKALTDMVASKRRKFGVEVLKRSVTSLLADIDSTFSKVLLKLGEKKKDKEMQAEMRKDQENVVAQVSDVEKHPRKKQRGISDVAETAEVVVPEEDKHVLPHRENENCGGALVPSAAEPKDAVPRTEIEGDLALPEASKQAKTSGRWKKKKMKQEQQGFKGPRKLTKSQAPVLKTSMRRSKLENWQETISGGVMCTPRKGMGMEDTKDKHLPASGQEQAQVLRPSTLTRSLRSQKGSPLMGADDLPVTRRRKRGSKSRQANGEEQVMAPTCDTVEKNQGSAPVLSASSIINGAQSMVVLLKSRPHPEPGPSIEGQLMIGKPIPPKENGGEICTAQVCADLLLSRQNGISVPFRRGDRESLDEKDFVLDSEEQSLVNASTRDKGAGDSKIPNASWVAAAARQCGITAQTLLSDSSDTVKDKSALKEALDEQQKLLRSAGWRSGKQEKEESSMADLSCAMPEDGEGLSCLPSDRKLCSLVNKLKADGGLSAFLRTQGLEQLLPFFMDHKMDESTFLQLTMNSLKDMGIQALGPRRKLVSAISNLWSS